MQVLVVIVNFRTPELTISSLRSVASERRSSELSCIIVDNNSSDSSAEKIDLEINARGWGGWCRVIAAKVNDGFSAGNNIGVCSANCEAYLLLNSDTVVRPGAIDRMVEELLLRPDAGLISPRLEWLDGTPQVSCFRFYRPFTELLQAAATGPLTRLFAAADIAWPACADGGHDYCEPDWTSFACVLIRREVFDAMGLMDDGYFMYFDDVDFCRLALQRGFKVVHCPHAQVVHLRGGSSPVKQLRAQRKRRPRYYFAARSRYYAKHFGRLGLLRANLFWTAGWVIALARMIGGRKVLHVCQREWLDIWTNFTNPLMGRHR